MAVGWAVVVEFRYVARVRGGGQRAAFRVTGAHDQVQCHVCARVFGSAAVNYMARSSVGVALWIGEQIACAANLHAAFDQSEEYSAHPVFACFLSSF